MIGVLASSFVAAGGADPLARAFVTYAGTGSNATTYTFTGVSFGPESANRTLVVSFHARAAGSDAPAPTVTIGGISATVDVYEKAYTSDTTHVLIAHAAVPTGTTGTLTVTFGKTYTRCGYGVLRVEGLVTPMDSGVDQTYSSGSLATGALTTSAGGLVVAAPAFNSSSSGVGATWDSALTEDFLSKMGSESMWYGMASGLTDGSSVSPSIVFGGTASLEQAFCAATYAPA